MEATPFSDRKQFVQRREVIGLREQLARDPCV